MTAYKWTILTEKGTERATGELEVTDRGHYVVKDAKTGDPLVIVPNPIAIGRSDR